MKPLQPLPFLRPGPRAACLLLGLCLGASGAWAQWQWRDANGSRVVSDMPPPPSVPESRILKRPGNAPAPVAAAPQTPAPGTPAAAPAKPVTGKPATEPGRDPTLEGKVKQEEDQKRKAEETRIAKVKADNCQSARQVKATLDSGQRIARTNAQGEREFMDEKAVADEARRAERAIAANCS